MDARVPHPEGWITLACSRAEMSVTVKKLLSDSSM